MSPHTDAGELLKLADEIERACKAPNYEARLGTIEGKMVVDALLRQAPSHGSAGGERAAIIEECAKVAEGTAPIARGSFFQARRNQCAHIALSIRALPKLTAAGESGAAQEARKPIAWMNLAHVESYQAGQKDGIAWASPVQSDFYTVALYASPSVPSADRGGK